MNKKKHFGKKFKFKKNGNYTDWQVKHFNEFLPDWKKKEYCLLGYDDSIDIVEWDKRGKYGARNSWQCSIKNLEFLESNEKPKFIHFGKKVRLKNKDFCLLGYCSCALNVVEWEKRGEYFTEYKTGNINDLEFVND